MAHTRLVQNVTEKVNPMPPTRMQQIKAALEEIESLKKEIVLTEFNENMPFVIKRDRLRKMRESLFLSEHIALRLIQEEIEDLGEGTA